MSNKMHLSWGDMENARDSIISQMCIDRWCPDMIAGVSRGGLALAVLMSHRLGVPMAPISVHLRDHSESHIPDNLEYIANCLDNGLNVLVVDDINDSGATINHIASELIKLVIEPAYLDTGDKCRFAVALNKESSDAEVEYAHQTLTPDQDDIWWVFPYEK